MRSLLVSLVLAVIGPPRGARPPAPPADAGSSAEREEQSDAGIAERVRTYLGAIDTPVRVSDWRSLGARAVPALERVFTDGRALPSRRSKAIEGLSCVGGERATALVLRAAADEAEPLAVRLAALRGAARVVSGERLVSALSAPLTGSADATVRQAAAEVLAHHGRAKGCAAVRAQSEREADRSRFERALLHCGR